MPSLTTQARQTLLAAMDRIIPADDYPSASQNGVMDYYDKQFSCDLADDLAFYQLGLNALNDESLAAFKQPFTDLSSESQDQLLASVENGSVKAHWLIEPARFFMRLVDHVAEGYYADHEYNGGNPGEASWRMIGFLNRTGMPDDKEGVHA